MDEWLNYLYVVGAVDDNTVRNPLLKNLYYEYKRRFPDNPVNEDFFFNHTIDEQINLFYNALISNEPISSYTK